MTNTVASVYGGVDTHKDVHVAAVVDDTGKLLGTRAFPTSPLGLAQCQRWISKHGQVAKIGVEGTSSYGQGLAAVLMDAGHRVIEVNRPNRQMRRAKGKNDTVDAEAAARAVLAGHATVAPKLHDGVVESIRILRLTLRASRTARVRVGHQLGHLIVTAPPALRIEYEHLPLAEAVQRAARMRPDRDVTDCTTAARTAMKMLAKQYLALTADLEILRSQLTTLVRTANPGLLQVFGVGVDTASALLIAAGDNPERMRSEAAFAALCGVAPIEASSGKTSSYRLSRGGNRDANSALWRIVMVRITSDARTRDYVARRTAEGKSRRAIVRCLKRFVAREVFHQLTQPKPAIDIEQLRVARQSLAAPLRVPASELGVSILTISRIERGLVANLELIQRYQRWLEAQTAA